jgi:hypothetical protein
LTFGKEDASDDIVSQVAILDRGMQFPMGFPYFSLGREEARRKWMACDVWLLDHLRAGRFLHPKKELEHWFDVCPGEFWLRHRLGRFHNLGFESFCSQFLEMKKSPNKAPEPTRGLVTDRANARSAPSPRVAHL